MTNNRRHLCGLLSDIFTDWRTRNSKHGVIQINVFQGEKEEGHWHCLTSSFSIKQKLCFMSFSRNSAQIQFGYGLTIVASLTLLGLLSSSDQTSCLTVIKLPDELFAYELVNYLMWKIIFKMQIKKKNSSGHYVLK